MKTLLTKTYLKFSKVTIIHSSPGRIRLQVPGLNKIPKEYRHLENELLELIKLLPGVTDLSLCFISGRALLHFDQAIINEKKLVNWFNTVWDTISKQFSDRDDIEDENELISLVKEELHRYIKEFSNDITS